MKIGAVLLFTTFGVLAQPAHAEASELEAALSNGLKACEGWILEPNTWVESEELFAAKIGLEAKLLPIAGVPPGVLPEGLMASATNFWRIDGGNGNGVFVVASSTNPVCNVAAGGPSDLQPDVEVLINKIGNGQNWKSTKNEQYDGMTSTHFTGLVITESSLIISRASKAGDRTDRVQFLATLTFNAGN
jgi:hypothetical protein